MPEDFSVVTPPLTPRAEGKIRCETLFLSLDP